MMKAAMLSASLCMLVGPAMADPEVQFVTGRPRRVELVSRQSADVYVRIGGPERFKTLGCTVSATMMTAVVLPGPRPYVAFIDRDGEEEGRCEIDVGKRRVRTAPPAKRVSIPRAIAVVR